MSGIAWNGIDKYRSSFSNRAEREHQLFTKEFFAKLRESGEFKSPREAMTAANEAWSVSDRNPKNRPSDAALVGPRAWRAAAASAVAPCDAEMPATDQEMAEGEVREGDQEMAEGEVREGDEMPQEGEIQIDQQETAEIVDEDLPPIDNTPESREAWREAAVCFSQIGSYDAELLVDDDMNMDIDTDTANTKVRAAFLTEIGKDPTLPGGHGPLGLCMLRETAERLQRRGVRELHAISRETHAVTGAPFEATENARQQFVDARDVLP